MSQDTGKKYRLFKRDRENDIKEEYAKIERWNEDIARTTEYLESFEKSVYFEVSLELEDVIANTEEKIKKALKRIERLHGLIEEVGKSESLNLEPNKSKQSIPEKKFSVKMGWIERIRFFLDKEQKILRAADFLRLSIEHGDKLTPGTPEFKKAQKDLGASISTYQVRGELSSVKKAGQIGQYIGYTNWFEDNYPLPKYRPQGFDD